jgi:hypothetical protein
MVDPDYVAPVGNSAVPVSVSRYVVGISAQLGNDSRPHFNRALTRTKYWNSVRYGNDRYFVESPDSPLASDPAEVELCR